MRTRIAIWAAVLFAAVLLLRHAGSYLAVNSPEHADLILVVAGGNSDSRYWNGLRLMDEGWAPRLMLDVFDKGITFGNKDVDLARAFAEKTAPGRVTVCPIAENSTYDEARYTSRCLQALNVKSILVVTSEYHTRRTMEIFRKRLPQYQLSFYGAPEPYFFGQKWWQRREWAKTTLSEWQRYLWWVLVDRWRSEPVPSG